MGNAMGNKGYQILLSLLILMSSAAQSQVLLTADFRLRPPLMTYGKTPGTFSGDLVNILELACQRAGCELEWQEMPLQRSLHRLQSGEVHLVPRLIRNDEREHYTAFIGPVAVADNPIIFIKHKYAKLDTEQQLFAGTLGVKLGTYYSTLINDDPRLKKYQAADDTNLAKMFAANRFDYIAVIDKSSIEAAFQRLGFRDYDYAALHYANHVPVYFGFSKHADHQEFIGKLQQELQQMVTRGEIDRMFAVGLLSPLKP